MTYRKCLVFTFFSKIDQRLCSKSHYFGWLEGRNRFIWNNDYTPWLWKITVFPEWSYFHLTHIWFSTLTTGSSSGWLKPRIKRCISHLRLKIIMSAPCLDAGWMEMYDFLKNMCWQLLSSLVFPPGSGAHKISQPHKPKLYRRHFVMFGTNRIVCEWNVTSSFQGLPRLCLWTLAQPFLWSGYCFPIRSSSYTHAFSGPGEMAGLASLTC